MLFCLSKGGEKEEHYSDYLLINIGKIYSSRWMFHPVSIFCFTVFIV